VLLVFELILEERHLEVTASEESNAVRDHFASSKRDDYATKNIRDVARFTLEL
jgi:hypothetical protein